MEEALERNLKKKRILGKQGTNLIDKKYWLISYYLIYYQKNLIHTRR